MVEAEWRSLAVERGNAFVTPEWALAWLEQYGDTADPFTLVARDGGGTLKGLMPLVRLRKGRSRQLQFAGGAMGDHFHPVALEDDETAVAAACARAIAGMRREWNIAVFHHVAVGAPWLASLLAASPTSLVAHRDAPVPLPYISLEGLTWEQFVQTRSKTLRRELRHDLRKLQEQHAVTFRQTSSPSDVAGDVALFVDLHDRRWRGQSESTLAGDRGNRFLADFAARAQRAGWLRLWFLEIDDQPAATWLGWRVGARYGAFQCGFDPAWSKHSPGLLMQSHAIQAATEEGVDEYDLLLGDEAHKTRFTELRREVQTVAVTRLLHPLGAVVAAEMGSRRLARKLPPRATAWVRDAAAPIIDRLPTSRNS